MGAVAASVSAKAKLTVEDIAQSRSHDEYEEQRQIGINPEQRGNRPIAPRDEQSQQSAAYAEADNLPNQYASRVAVTHLFALALGSHLSQHL